MDKEELEKKAEKEILQEIVQRGFVDTTTEFERIPVVRIHVADFNRDSLETNLEYLEKHYIVDADKIVISTRLKVLLKRFLRKVVGAYIKPLIQDQNLYNTNVSEGMDMIYAYILENEKKMRHLEATVKELEEKVREEI